MTTGQDAAPLQATTSARTAALLAMLDPTSSGMTVFDLARPMRNGMPQSPNHPEFRHALTRRHGDAVRADGGSAAADLLVTGAHVGTHIDALGHVSHCGQLHGGADAAAAQVGGSFVDHGIHTTPPMVCRGVLLDVPAACGVAAFAGGYEITVDDLVRAVERQGTPLRPGDVAIVRSGWGRHWDDGAPFLGKETGVPGVGEAGAIWLADHGIRATGADTIAYECLPAGAGHALLPAHRVLLVERGINIIETMALEELAAGGVHEFLFVCAPLPLYGATGSPVRPLAVVLS